MGDLLMQPQIQEDDDLGAIGFDDNQQDQMSDEDLSNSAINLDEYSKSEEAQESTWWDWTKDVAIQPLRGIAQAFTWPLDVLKIGMLGEGLSNIDEIEEISRKAGKPFDRDKYIKTVMEQGDYIPTQSFFEGLIEDASGVSLKPKTETGKFLNKASTIASLTKGGGLSKLAAGTAAGASKQALTGLGVNETTADIASDVIGGSTQALKKVPRVFTPEAEKLRKLADKFGLPFHEFMTKPAGGIITPKVSKARETAIMKELNITSEQAAKQILEGKLPISELRKQGVNLEELQQEAYSNARQLAKSKPQNIDPTMIIEDIDNEIKRLKDIAPSPGQGTQEAINILEREKSIYKKSLPKKENTVVKEGAKPPPEPIPISSEQLINQHVEYNSNVKGIYKKPELAGKEEDIRNTYAFLNSTIRKTLEKQGGADVAKAFGEANKLFNQNAILKRSEALIDKAFVNGEYSPKKLKQVLNSKQGLILRKDIGSDGVKDLIDIADYGEKAVNHTSQLLKSPKYAHDAISWGTLAPFILGATTGMKGALYLGKPIAERVKGYLLTRPASREAYSGIIKNAAKGSFNNMKADFSKLEKSVIDEFGSTEAFVKQIIDDLQVHEGDLE